MLAKADSRLPDATRRVDNLHLIRMGTVGCARRVQELAEQQEGRGNHGRSTLQCWSLLR